MSHELRTPMNAIVGYAELLSRPNVEPDKQATWVTNIRRSTDHLLSLINDVLDLSKIEAGEMRIENAQVDIAQSIAAVQELLRAQAAEKLLELTISYDGDVPKSLETDPVRFKQVLINLVGNAIKFTNEGSVTVRVTTRASDHGEGRLVIDVVDTGVGIEEEDCGGIFRPFTQGRAPRDARFGGTGLGLDISRQLSHLMGGGDPRRERGRQGQPLQLRATAARGPGAHHGGGHPAPRPVGAVREGAAAAGPAHPGRRRPRREPRHPAFPPDRVRLLGRVRRERRPGGQVGPRGRCDPASPTTRSSWT